MIPAFTYLRAWEQLQDELVTAMRRVMESGCLILGPEVEAFENEFARFVGAEFGIGASSGTDALIIALRALGIGANDQVLTVANGPVPTVSAIRAVGAVPIFVDIDPLTLQMCPHRLQSLIHTRVNCVIPIHLYGHAAPIREIVEIAQRHGVPVIEDCAQAHGTFCLGKHVGTFGKIGCFSFYPTKNLGAFGDAGLCTTDDRELAIRLRSLACYGFRDSQRIAVHDGINARLDELQAAFLRVRLKYLSSNLARRQRIANQYQSGLENGPLKTLGEVPGNTASWHQFVVRTPLRNRLMAHLNKLGIQAAIHYPHPVHRMPAYRELDYHDGSLPNTEQACRDVLSLPMFPELFEDEIQRIVAACLSFDPSSDHSGL